MRQIFYYDKNSKEISLSEALLLERYWQVAIDEEQGKVTNTIEDGVIIGKKYAINAYDEMPIILRQEPCAAFELTHVINGYTVDEYQHYKKVVIDCLMKTVVDIAGNCIYFQKYDGHTEAFKHAFTEKSYYNELGEWVYQFLYNKDGSCSYIEEVQVISTDAGFMAFEIGTNPEVKFTWDGFEYYKNAEPVIPES
jgi:hypothetical protein